MAEGQEAKDRAKRLARRARDTSINPRYTRFVRILRLALPLAAAVILVIVFLRFGGTQQDTIQPIEHAQGTPEIKKDDVARNELVNPRFVSVDRNNQPFEIVAKRALQDKADKDVVFLDLPVGVMNLNNGEVMTLRAGRGVYRQEAQSFFLEEDVALEHSAGYRLSGVDAHVDMKATHIWTERAVRGAGPEISIDAAGLQIFGEEERIVFTGPARLILSSGFAGLK